MLAGPSLLDVSMDVKFAICDRVGDEPGAKLLRGHLEEQGQAGLGAGLGPECLEGGEDRDCAGPQAEGQGLRGQGHALVPGAGQGRQGPGRGGAQCRGEGQQLGRPDDLEWAFHYQDMRWYSRGYSGMLPIGLRISIGVIMMLF
jgi:hypothetical protein